MSNLKEIKPGDLLWFAASNSFEIVVHKENGIIFLYRLSSYEVINRGYINSNDLNSLIKNKLVKALCQIRK